MLHADIVFDDVIDFGCPQRLGQSRRLLRRKALVDAGATDIDARLDLGRAAMRAVGRVAGQIAAVEARRRPDALRIGRSGIQRPRPAHAVADGSDRPGRAVSAQRLDEGATVAYRHRLGGPADHAADFRSAFLGGEAGPGVERAVVAEAVEKIRHQYAIALTREPFGHPEKRRPGAKGIHIKDDAGLAGTSARRLEKARFRHAVLRPDFNVPLRHLPAPLVVDARTDTLLLRPDKDAC